MNKKERVLRTIKKESIDYLPSQICFSDKSRYKELSTAFGLASEDEVDPFLENHIHFTYVLHDYPIFFRNDLEKMRELEKMGYCGIDTEHGMIYDCWGMGAELFSDGVFISYHPLFSNEYKNNCASKFLPADFDQSILHMDFESAIKHYSPPNNLKAENFSIMEKELKCYGNDMLVVPAGNFGAFERANSLTGFEEFMVNLLLETELMEEFLDKVFEFKIEEAKIKSKMDFQLVHYSDDLASQVGTLFSKDVFRKVFLPRMKKLFDIYKSAGMYIQMHSCGNITDFLPDLIDIGLDVIEPVQPCMDFKYLKREFGKDLTFFGGIDTQRLPFMTPEEAKIHTREVIRTLGKGGGLIIAPSQELMRDISIENIKAIVETIREEREIALNL